LAGAALGVATGYSDGSSTSTRAVSLAQFVPIGHGVRRGVLLAGNVPAVGRTAVYEPAAARGRRNLRAVYIVSGRRSPGALARAIRLASTGDQLVWDATVPPFVAVVAPATSSDALGRLESWTQAALHVSGAADGSTVLQSSAIEHTSFAADLTAVLQSPAA